MAINHNQEIVQHTDKQLNEVLISNRYMTENSLRMRAMAYLAQIKANLLTETIYELNQDKKIFASHTKNLESKNKQLLEQKRTIEAQNEELKKLISLKKENEFIKFQSEELVRLNENLNIASKVAKIGFWDIEVRENKLNWSEGTLDIFEVEDRSGSYEAGYFLEFLTQEWSDKVQSVFNASVEQKKDYFIIHEITTAKGNVKYVEERAKHYYDDNGEHIKSIGSVLDITELMLVQGKLDKEQKKFHEMFKKHDSMMMLIEPESGRILDANEKAVVFYGYSYNELLSMTISDINILPPDEVKKKRLEAKEKKLNHFEFPHRLKNGEIRVVDVSASPIETAEGIVLFSVINDITKDKENEERLKTKKEEFESIFNLSKDGIAVTDMESNFIDCNSAYCHMTGYSKEEILTKSCLELSPEEDRKEFEAIPQILLEKGAIRDLEKVCIKKDGTRLITNMSLSLFHDQKRVLITAKDITEKHRYQNKLEQQQEELKAINEELKLSHEKINRLLNLQNNMVIVSNGKTITYGNHKLFDFLGYENLEEFKQHYDCICDHFIENDRFFHLGKINNKEDWIKEINRLPHKERIVSILSKNFHPYIFAVSIKKFEQDEMIITFTDISQTMIEYLRMEEKTLNDKLTGAYNREFFEQNINNIILECSSNQNILAVAVLDIDHFKLVNDTFGHDVGDECLIHFVKVVRKYSRDDDILIRWGGEEFVLLLKVQSQKNLQKALEHIRKTIEIYNFPKVGKKTCSIGGTLYKNEESILTTIKRADEAVYDAKNHGRNMVVVV